MNSIKNTLLKTVGLLAVVVAASSAAHAGYYDAWGYYHVTCVPGYWANGWYGPFWVPAVCG